MDWFRRHIKTGSRLALLALAIQFVLAFGHNHGHARADGLSAGAVADAVIAEYGAAPVTPADDHDSHPAGDGCAICTVAALAAHALFSASPILHLPEAVTLLQRVTDAGFNHLDPARAAFQPRAPPAS